MKTAIEVKQVKGHYEIYWHGVFKCSCDPDELASVLKKIEEEENGED